MACTDCKPTSSSNFLKSYIGRHLLDLFQDLDLPAAEIDPLIAKYRQIYAARKAHRRPSRIRASLEALAALGGRKSTATTKGTPTTRIVLEQFGFLPYFDHVQGTDGFPPSPRPM